MDRQKNPTRAYFTFMRELIQEFGDDMARLWLYGWALMQPSAHPGGHKSGDLLLTMREDFISKQVGQVKSPI